MRRHPRDLLAAVLLLALMACGAVVVVPEPQEAKSPKERVILGKVVKVSDGDTLKLLTAEQEQVSIRISGIDVPESRQPFGQASKEGLIALVAQAEVVAHCAKNDQYGRSICRVEVGGVDVGLRQLQAGLAWHYKQFEREQPEAERQTYAAAERGSCMARRGLWGDKAPVAPWDWRQASKAKDGPPAVTPAASYPCQR